MKNTKKTNLKTEWNLKALYSSLIDKNLEKDLVDSEKAYTAFATKYKTNTTYVKDENALSQALSDYEKILNLQTWKPYIYLRLNQDTDSQNQAVRSRLTQVQERIQKISNITLFFEINLSKIPTPLQKKFLANKKLAPYSYFLKKIFDASKFVLSEPEEKIINLKSLPAKTLWVDATKKVKGKLSVVHKGKKIPLSEAESLVRQLPTQKERKELHVKIMDQYMTISDMAEAELNAVVINKKINDELRGHEMPYDSTILGYENDKATVLNLVNIVTKNFSVSQRFYALKRKMLGLKKMVYSDRSVPVGKTKKKISFEEAYQSLKSTFATLDPEFARILEMYAQNGQIDAYPKLGKGGGAYCWANRNLPTYIFLNHTNTFDSLMTFAHEMGHGIHGELSKIQPVLYDGHSTATAEVASTLFEAFVFYDQFEKLSDTEKIVSLHDKIQSDISTIFRQIACFNFELEMHTTVKEKGSMSKEDLAACMNKHMKAYLGNVTLDEKDRYFFIGWSHIRNFFYVYSYAFGQLASKALYAKYKEDPKFMEKIKQFLSAGGSMSPEDIFKSIGVDVTKPDFFQKGIKTIEDDIALLEKLTAPKKTKTILR